MDPSSSSQHFPLPAELLQRVLQHVDLPHRMGPCARVCRMWHAAVIAATSSISFADAGPTLPLCSRADLLTAWLQKHGGQCCKLSVDMQTLRKNFAEISRCPCLPCMQLTKLEELSVTHAVLRPYSTQLNSAKPASSNSTGVQQQQQQQAALTGLTSLELWRCVWVDWQGGAGLPPLSTLTNLRALRLHPLNPLNEEYNRELNIVLDSALSRLVQLTQLQLQGYSLSDEGLTHLSCLQQLRLLMLNGDRITAASLAALPSHITKLHLGEMTLSSIDKPQLAQLTGLQHLSFNHVHHLDPGILEGLWQLQHLELQHCEMANGDSSTTLLLSVVSRMTRLQHLELRDCCAVLKQESAYAALTASRQLTHLEICQENLPGLPGEASKYLFPASRQLPRLQVLTMPFEVHGSPVEVLEVDPRLELLFVEQQQQQQQSCQVIIDRIIGSCSRLQRLDLSFRHSPGADSPHVRLEGLTNLAPGLTRLSLFGAAVTADALASTVAQLSSLRQLELNDVITHGNLYTGVLQLTQLTQLQLLHVIVKGLQPFPAREHRLQNQALDGSPPDVWQQLQEVCSSNCSECAQLMQALDQASDCVGVNV